MLGDVSGKGVHAAIVTSMARYTVRTLSAQGWRPRQVLEQLNDALLAADDPERFCTVVYGHVERHLPPPDGPGGVRLTLALGGHPPPLLRRRDRSVQPVGTPGTALGLVPGVEIHEVHLDLAPGDVLLAYTDGVTEARRGEEQFGEERLAGGARAPSAPRRRGRPTGAGARGAAAAAASGSTSAPTSRCAPAPTARPTTGRGWPTRSRTACSRRCPRTPVPATTSPSSCSP